MENWTTVPLSEEEQRILHEIERSFYAGNQAPGSSPDSHAHDVKRIRLAAVGFIASLGLLLFGFAASFAIGALAFLAMVVTGAFLVDGVRRVGGERLRSSAGRLGAAMTEPSRRIRRRPLRAHDADDTDE